MRVFVTIMVFVTLLFAILVGGISYNSYLNRNKQHVYSAEELSAIECSKRGGNPITKVGWENEIHVQEYKCEVTK